MLVFFKSWRRSFSVLAKHWWLLNDRGGTSEKPQRVLSLRYVTTRSVMTVRWVCQDTLVSIFTGFTLNDPRGEILPQHCAHQTTDSTQQWRTVTESSTRSGQFSEAHYLRHLWLLGSGFLEASPFCTSVLCTCRHSVMSCLIEVAVCAVALLFSSARVGSIVCGRQIIPAAVLVMHVSLEQ